MGRFLEALKIAANSNTNFMEVAQTVTKKEEVIDFFRDAIQASKDIVEADGMTFKVLPEEESIARLRDTLLEEMDLLSKDEQERMAELFDFVDMRKLAMESGIPVILLIPVANECPGCPNCQPDTSSMN